MKSISAAFMLAAATTAIHASATGAAQENAPAQGATPQLALKQDFERADSIRDWRLQTPAGAKPYSFALDNAPNAAHSGQAALKYEVTEAGEKERYLFSGAKLPAGAGAAGRTLRIRFFARTTAATDGQAFTFRVLERDEAKPTGWLGGKPETIWLEPGAAWKEYSFTGQLADKTQGLTLYLVAKKPAPGQALWIDDLSLEVVPPAQ